jgi:hypothetical protein
MSIYLKTFCNQSQKECFENNANSFSIIFSDEPGKKHFFVAETERYARQWEAALKRASYQKMREHLVRNLILIAILKIAIIIKFEFLHFMI